ncbi:MAG: ornithine cyclodeaminase family protein [SAR324 cluster bacterium]|nr:ornithine cyclodeaminase family protein [SAR324 cluster bacterium]
MTGSKINPIILSAAEVEELLSMETAIELMRDAFAIISNGSSQVPVRTVLPIEEYHGASLTMPSYISNKRVFGIKSVTAFLNNPTLSLPAIQAIYLLFDAATGQLKCLMDADTMTMLRTGAGAGLATELLAREDAAILAVFGTGVQARGQMEAICAVRAIQKIYVFCRDGEKGEKFCQNMSERLQKDISLARSIDLLKEADIVSTATSSSSPVFEHHNLKPGVHINSVGSFTAKMAEVPSETVCLSKLVVDQREAALKEAGDLLKPIEEGKITKDYIFAELGEIVLKQKTGRKNNSEITFFKSVGNAVQDLVCADMIEQQARHNKMGSPLNL